MRSSLCALLSAILLTTTPTSAQSTQESPPERGVQADIALAVTLLARKAKRNIVLAAGVKGTVDLAKVGEGFQDTLAGFADAIGCCIVKRDGKILEVRQDTRASFEFVNRPATEAIAIVAKKLRLNVVFDATMDGRVTLKLENETYRSALAKIAEAAGCVVTEGRGGVLLLHKHRDVHAVRSASHVGTTRAVANYAFQRTDIREVIKAIAANAKREITVPRGVRGKVTMSVHNVDWRTALDLALEQVQGVVRRLQDGSIRIEQQPRIVFSMNAANVQRVLGAISRVSQTNIVVGPDVTGSVSMRLHQVPTDAALEAIAAVLGCRLSYEGGLYHLTRRKRAK